MFTRAFTSIFLFGGIGYFMKLDFLFLMLAMSEEGAKNENNEKKESSN